MVLGGFLFVDANVEHCCFHRLKPTEFTLTSIILHVLHLYPLHKSLPVCLLSFLSVSADSQCSFTTLASDQENVFSMLASRMLCRLTQFISTCLVFFCAVQYDWLEAPCFCLPVYWMRWFWPQSNWSSPCPDQRCIKAAVILWLRKRLFIIFKNM